MPHLPEPKGNDSLKRTRSASEGASLIRVAASEQQQPSALGRCPVCGTPYTLGAEPATTLLPEPSSPEPSSLPSMKEAARPAEPSALRAVLRCPVCGTYSVGTPPEA